MPGGVDDGIRSSSASERAASDTNHEDNIADMPGAYVPPHLRNKAPGATQPRTIGDLEEGRFTLDEISEHFWPADDKDGSSSSGAEPLTKTLHDSRKTPGKLAFVILFHGANPRWESDCILFTKSHLELLPGSGKAGDSNVEGVEQMASEEGSVAGAPVAAFKQAHPMQQGRSYIFEAWYRIQKIEFLEPRSPELVRMLKQKFTRVGRNGKVVRKVRSGVRWEESLGLRWAVAKFGEVKGERGAPGIERED